MVLGIRCGDGDSDRARLSEAYYIGTHLSDNSQHALDGLEFTRGLGSTIAMAIGR